MLNLLDEVLRAVLSADLGVPPAGPTLSFDVPNEDFAGRVSGRTLNVYLAEVRENREHRRSQYDTIHLPDRSVISSQPPAYFDCHYLISAWSGMQQSEIATPVAEEHALLGAALRVFVRNPDVVPGALGVGGGPVFQDAHVYLGVAAPDAPRVVNDFWSTMKQAWRPTISLIATAPLDPLLDSPPGPVVVTFVQRVGVLGGAANHFEELVHIGGWVLELASERPIQGATVERISNGEVALTDAQGRFSFSGLRPGVHRFRASAPGMTSMERNLDVPGGDPLSHVFRLA